MEIELLGDEKATMAPLLALCSPAARIEPVQAKPVLV
jgi:hypothetical protein